MSYAEDEADVEGTVNGVTATTTGTETLSGTHLTHPGFFSFFLSNICIGAEKVSYQASLSQCWSLSRWGQHW